MRLVTWKPGLATLAVTALFSCSDEEPTPNPPAEPGNIVEVANGAGFTKLLAAATAAGLADALAGPGPLTVFAPTDAAFDALGGAAPSDPDLLANVLLHHVVAGRLTAADVTSGQPLKSLANLSLSVDTTGSPIRVGGRRLSATVDVAAKNGIIHVLEEVIVPPTVLEAAAGTADLSTLATAVGAASTGVQNALGGGPITVFAPTNAAFAKIPAGDLSALLADQAALDLVLSVHVVAGQIQAADLSDGQTLTTVAGQTLRVKVSGGAVKLVDPSGGEAGIAATDLRLLNGAVHLIDTVLMPERSAPAGNLVEVATAAGGFGTLLGAATTAGLVDALTGPGPLTVFAPTDAAFGALGVDLSKVQASVIGNILLHHVVSGDVRSSAVVAATSLTTLAKTALRVELGTPVKIGGAALSSTLDVAASNGVIHVMDGVIVPPTILEAAAATADLSTLVAAVGAASSGVKSALAPATLTGAAPITVFAPTNAAFAKIPAADLNALLADQAALDRVLSVHVVAGQILAADLRDGQTLTTVAGQTLRVKVSGGAVKLVDPTGGEVGIAATDLRLLNGAVHLIDAVLMPERPAPAGNLVEVATAAGGFGTLLGAATTAGLVDALAGPGPLTVFAPTDAAFGALGVDLTKVQASVIANILLHHVVSGDVRSGAVVSETSLATLANTTLSVELGTPIKIGGASLSSTLDVAASNGVIHVMDGVIVPPTILAVATATPDLSTLVAAVGAASDGVKAALAPDTLGGAAPITVFAPTNAAFAAAGIDLGSLPQATLDAVLAHHAVGAQALSTELSDGQVIGALNGNLTVDLGADGRVTIVDGKGGRANVIATLKDIRTLTGVVHVIDAVLMP